MSDLITITKNIQRHYGLPADGKAGPLTMGAVWQDIRSRAGGSQEEDDTRNIPVFWQAGLDARTISNIQTLDQKVRGNFAQFTRLANATAATLGCSYVMIGGDRSWKEQDALYNQPSDGRDNDGDGKVDEADEKVTKAKGGFSNHNFLIAGDFGVFRGKAYLDSTDAAFAAKVHRACSVHAEECGLEWGGSWKSFKDLPHYEYRTGLTMAQKRAKFSKEGTIV